MVENAMRTTMLAVVSSLALSGAPVAFAQGDREPRAITDVSRAGKAQVQALIQDGTRLQSAGRFAEAEARFRSAVELAQTLSNPADRAELPRALDWLQAFYRQTNRYAEAWAAAERSLHLMEQQGNPQADSMRVKLAVIGIMSGEFAKAEPYLRQALANYERDPAKLKEVTNITQHLANALKGQGRLDEAAAVQRKAIAIMEGAAPGDPMTIALAYRTLAQIYAEQKRPAESDAAYDAALKAAQQVTKDSAHIVSMLALTQAIDHLKQGRLQSARARALEALEIRRTAFGADDPRSLETHITLGQVALAAKDRQEADRQFGFVLESYARKPTKETAPWMAEASRQLSLSLLSAHRFADMEKVILGAIAVRETMIPNDLAGAASSYQILSLSYAGQGKIDQAEGALNKTRELYGRVNLGNARDIVHGYFALSDAYFTAGRYREAAETMERARAIQATKNEPIELSMVELRQAIIYRYLRRFAESEALARKVLAVREEKLGPDGPLIAEAVFNLAAVVRWQDRYAEAEPLYRRALALREKTDGPDSQHALACRYGLAVTVDGLGRVAEAESLFVQLLADRQRVFGPEHTDVAETISGLVWNLRRQGKLDEAASMAERPLEIYRKRLGPDHPTVVVGLLVLATIRQDRSEYAAAEKLFRDALRIRTLTYGAESTNVADSYGELMRLSIARRQFEEAAGYSAKRLAISEQAFGAADPRLIAPLADLQSLDAFLGNSDNMELLARRILSIAERSFGPGSIQLAVASTNVAYTYRLRGKIGNIDAYYERPLAIYRSLLGPRHPWVAGALDLLADARVSTGQVQEAEALRDESFSILAERFGQDSPVLAVPLTNKALLLLQLKRLNEAESLLKKAAALLRKGSERPTVTLATVLMNLGCVYAAGGRQAEAENLMQEAVGIFKELYGPDRIPPFLPAPLLPPSPQDT